METMLMGAFDDRKAADQALYELEKRGFAPEGITVLARAAQSPAVSHQVAKAVGAGAMTGGMLGGMAGLLAGGGVAPMVTGSVGIAVGAAAGGVIGFLTGLGMTREAATSYQAALDRGGVVLGLNGSPDATEEAQAVFGWYGAHDLTVSELHEGWAEPIAGGAADAQLSGDDLELQTAAEARWSQASPDEPMLARDKPAGYRNDRRQPVFGERIGRHYDDSQDDT